MSHPVTDIICLVYNNLPVTKGFTERLFENTENFNLFFVDNGSTDEVAEYLKEGDGKDWTLITSETNLGIIKGRNLGAKHISSDHFMNIDNDQYPKKGWLQGLYDLLNEGYDIVGPEAWCLMPPDSQRQVVMSGVSVTDKSYYPFKHCSRKIDKFTYIGCGGMLIKKYVYDDIGMFDERFSPAYFEDPDFCFRAIKAGYKLGWKYDCAIDHLGHQTIPSQKLFPKHAQFVKSWKAFQSKWKPYYPKLMQMV